MKKNYHLNNIQKLITVSFKHLAKHTSTLPVTHTNRLTILHAWILIDRNNNLENNKNIKRDGRRHCMCNMRTF